jgi:hypothetical protein
MSTRAERNSWRGRLLAWGFAYTPAAALALLLPKCPLCLAAWLALLGVSIPVPSYARALLVVTSAVLATLVMLARRRRAREGARLGAHGCASCSRRIER